MGRRRLLALAALSVSGCLTHGSGPRGGSETPTEPPADTPTATPTDAPTPTDTPSPIPTATDGCEWPSMCEGSQLVEVVVDADFSGRWTPSSTDPRPDHA
jgi:hypothetical protein